MSDADIVNQLSNLITTLSSSPPPPPKTVMAAVDRVTVALYGHSHGLTAATTTPPPVLPILLRKVISLSSPTIIELPSTTWQSLVQSLLVVEGRSGVRVAVEGGAGEEAPLLVDQPLASLPLSVLHPVVLPTRVRDGQRLERDMRVGEDGRLAASSDMTFARKVALTQSPWLRVWAWILFRGWRDTLCARFQTQGPSSSLDQECTAFRDAAHDVAATMAAALAPDAVAHLLPGPTPVTGESLLTTVAFALAPHWLTCGTVGCTMHSPSTEDGGDGQLAAAFARFSDALLTGSAGSLSLSLPHASTSPVKKAGSSLDRRPPVRQLHKEFSSDRVAWAAARGGGGRERVNPRSQ
jgi:hypothetical protein